MVNPHYSAIAAVGQPCLERQLCFALPPAASGIMRAVQCRDDLSKRGRGRADERITSAFCATRKQIMPAEPSWFIEAANFAIRFSLEAERFYERKRAKTNAIVAFKAIAHKLARACYHMLSEGKPFALARCFAESINGALLQASNGV